MRRDPRIISNFLLKILGSRGIIKATCLLVFFLRKQNKYLSLPSCLTYVYVQHEHFTSFKFYGLFSTNKQVPAGEAKFFLKYMRGQGVSDVQLVLSAMNSTFVDKENNAIKS